MSGSVFQAFCQTVTSRDFAGSGSGSAGSSHIHSGIYMSLVFSVCLAFATAFVSPAGAPRSKVVVQAPPLQARAPTPAPGNPVVVMSTSMGEITLELYRDRAPVSVANFLSYVADGFYDGTIFHRVKPGFAIQVGCYLESMVEKTTRAPILNEAANGLRNTRGTLGMARLRALRSATSQFYINLVNNTMLDHKGYSPDDFGYAVFGQVLAGMDVVDKIATTPTGSQDGHENVPITPVIIKSVTLK